MDPESQELQLRRAGVPWENLFRDIGVSGSTGTQERRGWHRLDAHLAGGDTLVVVAIDRIGRTWQDTIRSICSLRDRGGEDQELGRGPGAVDQVPGGRRGEPRGLLRADPDHVCRLGCRPGTGIHQAPDPGWARAGPTAREDPGASPEGRPRATGGDAANAGRRGQPPEDRQRLRVLTQHGPEGPSTGGSGTMTGSWKIRSGTWSCRVAATTG